MKNTKDHQINAILKLHQNKTIDHISKVIPASLIGKCNTDKLESYSTDQKISYNIIKRSHINLVNNIDLQITLSSPKIKKNKDLNCSSTSKENKDGKKEICYSVLKSKDLKFKELSKSKTNSNLRILHNSIKNKMNISNQEIKVNNEENTSDIEEGVDHLMTPIINREPKTISRFFLKSNVSKMKSLKTQAKLSSRVYNVKL